MTKLAVIFSLVLFLCGCSPKGEAVAPPDGLEKAVRDYYTRSHWPAEKIAGISVRAYPNETFFVTVEGDSTNPLDASNGQELRHGVRYLIAQKAYNSGSVNWQIQLANKNNVKLYGIEPND